MEEGKAKKTRKRKLTPEENKALNASKPSRNKSVEAARRLKSGFIIYDPAFRL